MQAIDVHPGDVDVGAPVDNPVCERAPDAAAAENADRIQSRRDEIVANLGRLAEAWREIGREALGSAKELLHARVERRGHALHCRLEERRHPFPIRIDLAEREIVRDRIDVPRRAYRFEHPDHQAAAFLAKVSMRRRILDHRPRPRHARNRLGQQVVVLGRLQWNRDSMPLAELPRPRAKAVDDDIAGDVSARGLDADNAATLHDDIDDRCVLDDPHALHPRTGCQRHRYVDRIGATVVLHVEAGEDVVGTRERKQRRDFSRRDFLHVDAAMPIECGDPPIFLEPVAIGGDFNETDRTKAGRLAGLRFEACIEIARVAAERGRRFRRRAECADEARRMPCRSRRELRALEQHDVFHTQVPEVIRDRAADDAAAYDDDTGV